jgi:hypothetical protein
MRRVYASAQAFRGVTKDVYCNAIQPKDQIQDWYFPAFDLDHSHGQAEPTEMLFRVLGRLATFLVEPTFYRHMKDNRGPKNGSTPELPIGEKCHQDTATKHALQSWQECFLAFGGDLSHAQDESIEQLERG